MYPLNGKLEYGVEPKLKISHNTIPYDHTSDFWENNAVVIASGGIHLTGNAV